MTDHPSNSFLNKFEAAYSLADPENVFINHLRQSLTLHVEKKVSLPSHADKNRPKNALSGFFNRKSWVVIGIVLLVFLIAFIFRQPVLAAAGRLFGYGYFPEVGFIQLDTAQILQSPIKQEHGDSSLTVISGLATPKTTLLWIKFVNSDATAAGAWLETPSSDRIDFSYWNYDANQTDFIRIEFPPLAPGINKTTLMLPAGWQLPLTWVPATQSALPDVSVVQTVEPKTETDSTLQPVSENCSKQHGIQVCILAATNTGEKTSILVKADSANPEMVPGDPFMGLAWSTEQDPVTLRDANGVIYPLKGQQRDTLEFPALTPGDQKVTLTIPATIAKASIPEQVVKVDMGDDPQPDQQISVNADIKVLGSAVHFRKATFIGDGVNSLRMTLNAEPLETKNGITPYMLDMSKPDRIDDLYGTGGLGGSKGLFVELIRPQGKITGVLDLPIIGAWVTVAGPFEFTFSLSQLTTPLTSTPELANPDTFSPAPTPTPMSLDSYKFTGKLPKPGDLLFTVVNGNTTSLYYTDPTNSSEIEQIARLPGQVYQVYLHPDGFGIDYLVGEQGIDGDTSYFRSAQLFTLRFTDTVPRLSYTFPRGDGSIGGTELIATWSFDGKLLAYQRFDTQPKPGETYWKIGWINLNCRETGNCRAQEFQLPKGLDLYNPQFSPQGYVLTLQGYNSASGSGEEDIFLIKFNEQGTPGAIINLSNTDQIDEGHPGWNPKTGQVVALCPADVTMAKKAFCFYDPDSGERQEGATINLYNPQDFRVFPEGNDVLVENINPLDNGKGEFELGLVHKDGKAEPAIVISKWIDEFFIASNGKNLVYLVDHGKQLSLIDLQTKISSNIYSSSTLGAISWVRWAN
jgi:hypothetical protein